MSDRYVARSSSQERRYHEPRGYSGERSMRKDSSRSSRDRDRDRDTYYSKRDREDFRDSRSREKEAYRASNDRKKDSYRVSRDREGNHYRSSKDRERDSYRSSYDMGRDSYRSSRDREGDSHRTSNDRGRDLYRSSRDREKDSYTSSRDRERLRDDKNGRNPRDYPTTNTYDRSNDRDYSYNNGKAIDEKCNHDISGRIDSQTESKAANNSANEVTLEKPKTERRRRRWGDKVDVSIDKRVEDIENAAEEKPESKVKVPSTTGPIEEPKSNDSNNVASTESVLATANQDKEDQNTGVRYPTNLKDYKEQERLFELKKQQRQKEKKEKEKQEFIRRFQMKREQKLKSQNHENKEIVIEEEPPKNGTSEGLANDYDDSTTISKIKQEFELLGEIDEINKANSNDSEDGSDSESDTEGDLKGNKFKLIGRSFGKSKMSKSSTSFTKSQSLFSQKVKLTKTVQQSKDKRLQNFEKENDEMKSVQDSALAKEPLQPPSREFEDSNESRMDLEKNEGTQVNNEMEVEESHGLNSTTENLVSKDVGDQTNDGDATSFLETIKRMRENSKNFASESRSLKRSSPTPEAEGDYENTLNIVPYKSKIGSLEDDNIGDVYGDELVEYNTAEALSNSLSAQTALRAKKLKIKIIDHSKMSYLAIRKNLLIVPKYISALSADEIKDRRDEIDIKVRGKGCPPPIKTWEECGLSDKIISVLKANKFDFPLEVQQQSIPALMSGRDLIVQARTGSGKTLSFLLPLFRHVLDQPPIKPGVDGPIAIIFSPARELAVQIHREIQKFEEGLNFRSVALYGGVDITKQLGALKRGAEICVCTPGRLVEILSLQSGKRFNMSRISFVVLDEADRMFDAGFNSQMAIILQNIRPDRQISLFSATFPWFIQKIAKENLKYPLEITTGGRSRVSKNITQCVEVLHGTSNKKLDDRKFTRLIQLIGYWYDKGKILIFVDRQETCDMLLAKILKTGYEIGFCRVLYGGLDQDEREAAISDFKDPQNVRVMIATALAGRGLDVPEIKAVINYTPPTHLEDYIHLCGRTGRGNNKGYAYTFVTPDSEQYAPILVKALRQSKQDIPDELQKLSDGFIKKVEDGTAQWARSGYSTKGYKFDESEDIVAKSKNEQRKQYEIEVGLRLEGEDEETFDFTTTDTKDSEDISMKPVSREPLKRLTANGEVISVDVDKIQARAGEIAKSTLIVRGKDNSSSPIQLPSQSVSNQIRQKEVNGVIKYIYERDINNLPDDIRGRLTKKATHNEILKQFNGRLNSILVRGEYNVPGKKPLHLLVEAKDERDLVDVRKGLDKYISDHLKATNLSNKGGKFTITLQR